MHVPLSLLRNEKLRVEAARKGGGTCEADSKRLQLGGPHLRTRERTIYDSDMALTHPFRLKRLWQEAMPRNIII